MTGARARTERLGYALVVVAALLFVVNAGVSRVVLRAGVEPGLLTTARVTGSTVGFALGALVRGRIRPPRGRDLLVVAALGLAGVAAVQWTYNVAIDRLPLGIALLLEYTAPVLVALWSRFGRGQPVRGRMWAALAGSVVGLALVARVWHGLTLDGVGVLAGIGAAISFAVYFLLGESGVRDQDPLSVVLWSFLVAAVALNVADPATELGSAGLTGSASLLGVLGSRSAPLWLLLSWVVVLGTLVPFGCELYALRRLPATAVVVVAMREPVGAAGLGWWWFGESLDSVQVVGGGVVLVAIWVAHQARLPTGERPAADVLPAG